MEVRCSFGDISIVWHVTVTLHDGCYRRRLQSRTDRHIQLFDDLRRRLGWRAKNIPHEPMGSKPGSISFMSGTFGNAGNGLLPVKARARTRPSLISPCLLYTSPSPRD